MNGDTSASLTTQPTCSTTATSSSPAGNYPSSCSGAVDSNYAISYTNGNVTVSPYISSLTPGSAHAGDFVILSGAGFGATQDTSTLTFASVPAAASSWSDASIIAAVPAGASSGTVVVTVAGAASNGVNFTVLNPLPQVGSLTPNTGISGTAVTIAGAHFGAPQGTNSTVTFNDISATVGNWTDTEITVTAPAGLSAGTVPVAVTVGSQTSNGLGFTIPLTASPNFITVSPPTLSMAAGDSQQISVVDDFGRVVTGANLSVADTTVAQISTDGQQTLMAEAVATTSTSTVTATYGNLSAQEQVTVYPGTTLPEGTLRWSVPPVPNYSTQQIVQAQPTSSGTPDFYAIEGANNNGPTLVARALTAGGQEMWHVNFPGTTGSPPVNTWLDHATGDVSGGLLMQFTDDNLQSMIVRLDGATGQETWRYYSPFRLYPDWAVHPDGSIYVVEYPYYSIQSQTDPNSKLLAINGSNGTINFSVPIPPSGWVFQNSGNCGGNSGYYSSSAGAPMIAPDGSVNLEVFVFTQTTAFTEGCNPVTSYDPNMQLLQVQPGGGPSFRTISDNPDDFWLSPGEVIPDGQGGMLAAWTKWINNWPAPSVYEAHMTHITPTASAKYTLPLDGWSQSNWYTPPDSTLVLGENGVAFGTNGSAVVAFDPTTGNVNWSFQPQSGTITSMAATSGGGLAIQNSNLGMITLDPTGATLATASYLHSASILSLGEWTSVGSSDVDQGPDSELALLSDWPVSGGGNRARQRAPQLARLAYFIPFDPGTAAEPPVQTAEQTRDRLMQTVPDTSAIQRFFLHQDATINSFLSELTNPVQAVAFVGHSQDFILEQNGAVFSAGLILWDNSLVRTPDASVPEPAYEQAVAAMRKIDKIHTEAKIVFIGACYLGLLFMELWDIDQNTTDRALVVPVDPTKSVGLVTASTAWQFIWANLVLGKGMSISEAVTAANTQLTQAGQSEQWTVIGGQDVRLKPKPQ